MSEDRDVEQYSTRWWNVARVAATIAGMYVVFFAAYIPWWGILAMGSGIGWYLIWDGMTWQRRADEMDERARKKEWGQAMDKLRDRGERGEG